MKKLAANERLSIYLRLIVVISALSLVFLSLPVNPALPAASAPATAATATLDPPLAITPTNTAPAAQAPLRTATPSASTATPQPALTVSVSNPDTLKFVFPTQGPLPISLWRPPPYDLPWAPGPHDHFYFARPIAANKVNWPLPDYRYGGTMDDNDHLTIHTGIDIEAPFGTPVLAAGDGTVVWAGYGLESMSHNPNDPYGMAVLIRHNFGYQGNRLDTVYGHMSEIDVVAGEKVKVGTRIGLVGETGNATGPHLHFEVRVEENNFFYFQNPELWLVPPQGWGILVGRVMDSWGNLIHRLDIRVTSKTSDQDWTVRTYGNETVKSDPYYQENMVLSDLPAGDYTLSIPYGGGTFHQDITIYPGRVSYYTFKGFYLFKTQLPPTQAPDFLGTATPTPAH